MIKAYCNPGPLVFSAVIKRGSARNSWAYVDFPFDLKKTFGVGNLVPFKATFDSRVHYQGSLVKMGGSQAMILLRKDIKSQLGKEPGEMVEVRLELDDKPRDAVVPEGAKRALHEAGILEQFVKLPFTHRREYVRWIEEAKRPETRISRIEKTCKVLAVGGKMHR